MSDAGGSNRYQYVEIHLCDGCGETLEQGQNVVCLSDGYVYPGGEYEVENRRFWHRDCWKNRLLEMDNDR